MLRLTDTGEVIVRDTPLPATVPVMKKREVMHALEACERAIEAAGMGCQLNEDVARLRRYIETH
jgi:hypothetical protein